MAAALFYVYFSVVGQTLFGCPPCAGTGQIASWSSREAARGPWCRCARSSAGAPGLLAHARVGPLPSLTPLLLHPLCRRRWLGGLQREAAAGTGSSVVCATSAEECSALGVAFPGCSEAGLGAPTCPAPPPAQGSGEAGRPIDAELARRSGADEWGAGDRCVHCMLHKEEKQSPASGLACKHVCINNALS